MNKNTLEIECFFLVISDTKTVSAVLFYAFVVLILITLVQYLVITRCGNALRSVEQFTL